MLWLFNPVLLDIKSSTYEPNTIPLNVDYDNVIPV